MIGRSLYTATLRLSSLNWKDSITSLRNKLMPKRRFNLNTNTPTGAPKVVISQSQELPTPPTPENPLYCIEENVTTGWEIIETNLTKENCKSKYEHIMSTTGLPPHSVRIRRIK